MRPVTETRDHLVAALEVDLIGPFEEGEILRLPPSRWYLTGFLAAMDARQLVAEPEDDDELAAGSDTDEEAGPAETGAKIRHFLPASLGLSVLLPPAGAGPDEIIAVASWADYRAEDQQDDANPSGRAAKRRFWRRSPRDPARVRLRLDPGAIKRGVELPGAPGVLLRGKLATASRVPGLPAGTRALSLFLVNQRPGEKGKEDERFLFQVRLELAYEGGFLPRPNWRGENANEFDERVADLQFRDKVELAVGHGVATTASPDADGVTRRVATTWLPCCEVPRVETRQIDGVETRMEALAGLDDPAALRAALAPIPAAFAAWLAEQATIDPATTKRRETRDHLLADAGRTCQRIDEGIALLASDTEVRLAFRLMNGAMASQARRGRPGEEPHWRLFQLAFVLLALPSIADPGHPDREVVELIYFPTGGGKTEAYLGVIATVLLLRRLRGVARPDGGDGVAVLLRYTLRLLTLDQLARAATLICALELLRRDKPELLGKTRFAIGLWVGKSATANTLKEVAEQINQFKNRRDAGVASPLPITACPWCRAPLERDGIRLAPDRQKPQEVLIHCLADGCAFHPDRSAEGLPVLFVDEQIYRELPAFLIATVDKLAMLPWRGETGLLFGRATSRVGKRFFGPLDRPPKDGRRLPDGLRPPELIVQDELHLISGPLGTMVGLYEAAVEQLCLGPQVPKVIAATATVRQATEQVRALFGRTREPAIFPPRGIDDGETFFARLDHASPGRLYLGVAAPGRAMKALLLRVYVALLAAAQKAWDDSPGRAADAYMTLVGYFNSLRELGGMRRLVEDEVVRLCHGRGERRPEGGGGRRLFHDRRLQPEPLELTSREATSAIAEAKDRLGRRHDARGHVDVLLASNMISVGVDIPRLGLMVLAGQPKTTAEYIQASSRVGRLPAIGPGLVVTCYNVHKARDRSHYEHFTAYHQSFYRNVEASSLTPFSTRALGRGLAATLMALTRLMDGAMTPNAAAAQIAQHRAAGDAAVKALVERARRHRSTADGAVIEQMAGDLEQLGKGLLDSWERVVRAALGGGGRTYSPFDLDKQGGRPLLFTALEEHPPPPNSDDARFEAPTSMRDVEPTADLWLERQPLGGWRP